MICLDEVASCILMPELISCYGLWRPMRSGKLIELLRSNDMRNLLTCVASYFDPHVLACMRLKNYDLFLDLLVALNVLDILVAMN